MRLRTKLLVVNLSLIGALTLLALVLGDDFRRLANLPAQGKSIELRIEPSIRQLARASEVGLATQDRGALVKLVEAFGTDADVSFLVITDKDGQPLAKLGQASKLKATLRAAPGKLARIGEDLVSMWLPVEIEGLRLGAVAMGYSLARIQAANRRIGLFALLVIVAALFSALASIVVSAKITNPIVRMTRAFSRVAEGDLEQERVEVSSRDETGELAKAYNEMLAMLQELGETARQVGAGNLKVNVTAKGELADAFRDMLATLRELSASARRISQGNLTVAVQGTGDVASAFRQMIASQRGLVKQITETALDLTSAANQFQVTAEHQRRGALEQSSAVEQNRRTMESLLVSVRVVGDSAQDVLSNAEKADENSRLVADHIATLTAQTDHIGKVLAVIKGIANKSDLLALNAALEGTKAGELGKGFSLVAHQMRQLAENVMASVKNIKELTDAITAATNETVTATAESTALAAATTDSARQIALVIQQQQVGTEQMSKAMDNVAQIARQTADGSEQTVASAEELVRRSAQLQRLVRTFQLEQGPRQKRVTSRN